MLEADEGWVSIRDALPERYRVVQVHYKGYWPFAGDSEYHYTYTYRDGTWSGLECGVNDVEILAWRYENEH